MSEKWTPEQFWEYVEGLAGDFKAGQMREMLAERGLSLAAPTRQWPNVFNVKRSERDAWHGDISFASCPSDEELKALEISLRSDHRPAPTMDEFDRSEPAQSTARTVDLRSASVLLDSLDRIAESFKDVEPCRHNNDNLISDLKIELASLRGALSPAMMESGWQDARAHINARLEDLATANALYGKDNRLSAPEKIERNNREISWLKDLRSILGLSVARNQGEGGGPQS